MACSSGSGFSERARHGCSASVAIAVIGHGGEIDFHVVRRGACGNASEINGNGKIACKVGVGACGQGTASGGNLCSRIQDRLWRIDGRGYGGVDGITATYRDAKGELPARPRLPRMGQRPSTILTGKSQAPARPSTTLRQNAMLLGKSLEQ